MHSGYSPRSFSNDIALLALDRDVDYREDIAPVCLPLLSDVVEARSFVGTRPFVAGWGATRFQGPTSNTLQYAGLQVRPRSYSSLVFLHPLIHRLLRAAAACCMIVTIAYVNDSAIELFLLPIHMALLPHFSPPSPFQGDVEHGVWQAVRRLPQRPDHGLEAVHVRRLPDEGRVPGRLGRAPHGGGGRARRRHRARQGALVPDRHRLLRIQVRRQVPGGLHEGREVLGVDQGQSQRGDTQGRYRSVTTNPPVYPIGTWVH